ncbi:MAG: hypothetical protein ABI947_20585 [Chloroflexota bacterium]
MDLIIAPTFDPGPGLTDTVGVWRPSAGAFYLRYENQTGNADLSVTFGATTDLPLVGDWDGDGIDTVGVFRPTTTQFFLKNANTPAAPIAYTFVYGATTDIPVKGDWDGNGADGIGVYRPSNNTFYLRNSLSSGIPDFTMPFGIANAIPLSGNWQGRSYSGHDSPAYYNPDTSTFSISLQVCNCTPVTPYVINATLGVAGDSPFSGDWTGYGDGLGVFRPSNGLIYLRNHPTTGIADTTLVFGIPNDKPVAGHWGTTTDMLASYGITVYAQGSDPAQDPGNTKGVAWQAGELDQILAGVQNTANAFALFETNVLSRGYTDPKVIYKRIMGNFKVVHVINGFTFIDANGHPVADGCDGAINRACTSNDRGVILFYGNLNITPYTFVHEEGHRFDNQSNIPATNMSLSESISGANVVIDCGSPTITPGVPSPSPTHGPTATLTKVPARVMGEIINQPQTWTRGERGWGSGPAKIPGGGALITTFQQNPAFLATGVPKTTAVSEATADTFLNWVYSISSGASATNPCNQPFPGTWNGFHNEDWVGMTSNNAIPGNPDNTHPGSKRSEVMQNTMSQIFQQHTTW